MDKIITSVPSSIAVATPVASPVYTTDPAAPVAVVQAVATPAYPSV